ncbi:MAG: hypothetical protein ACYTDT_09805 [Planctomycetota bacterium]|jgi:hypothetical protein
MKPLTLIGILFSWLLVGGLGFFVLTVEEDFAQPVIPNRKAETTHTDDDEVSDPIKPKIERPDDPTAEEPTYKPVIDDTGSDVTTNPTTTDRDASTNIIDSNKNIAIKDGKVVDSVIIRDKGTLTFGVGTVSIVNDLKVSTKVNATGTTLQLTGNGEVKGNITANKIEVTAGTRRLTAGTRIASSRTGNAKPGQEGFYVAAGATVIIEKGASVNTSAAYGFKIDGTLIIDGGTFNCSFSNGNGKTTNRGWGDNSRLEVRSGAFNGRGDASFAGASIYMTGGKIDITDDLWNTGSSLDMSGGTIENSRWGGQFTLTGNVLMTGGELLVHANRSRGLYIAKDSNVTASGGKVVLFGGTLKYAATAALNEVEIQGTCSINGASDKQAALYINGGMTFVKGTTFNTGSYNVLVAGMSAQKGVYIPQEYQHVKSRAKEQVRFRGGGLKR